MKQRILLLLIIFYFANTAFTQQWIQKGGDIQGVNTHEASGASVALSADGNSIAVGSDYEFGGIYVPGFVKVYDWNGTSWVQRGDSIVSGATFIDDWFGETISLSADGNTIAIGAPNINLAQVYNWNGVNWVQMGGNISSNPWSIDLDNSGTILSVRHDTPAITGEDVIRVYMFDGFGWIQIIPDIIGEEIGEQSGMSISVSGDGSMLAYGAPLNIGGGAHSGSVRTYATGGFQIGSDIDGLPPLAFLGTSASGSAISLNYNGSRMAIGSRHAFPGVARVYQFTTDWAQMGSDILGSSQNGESVELNSNGDRLIVGDHSALWGGSLRTFEWNGVDWVQYGQEIFADNVGDGIGNSVSMSHDGLTIAGGAHGGDVGGTNTGYVRVYEYCVATASSITELTCSSYTVPSGDETYFSSGLYTDTIININGCDSIITIDLTVNYSNTVTDVQTACDSFTWIDGITYTSSTNSPTWTLSNAQGCDSIVNLDLTINYSNTVTDVQTACDSYTWIDGNAYTSSTNSPTWTLSNAQGCDSIVNLDLTINYSNTGTDVQTACDSFTWIDGITYTSSTNSPTWTLSNAQGCDSVVNLDLTVNYSNAGTDVQTACDSYTWIDGNTYTSTTNSPTWTLANAQGCDSIISLDLVISNVDVSIIQLDDFTIQSTASGVSYQWLDCNNNYAPILGETNQSYTTTINGSYAAQVTGNGCVDTSACITIANVGIIENDFGKMFVVYPNPTEGLINVSLGAKYNTIKVEVRDVSGKILSVKGFSNVSSFDVSVEGETGQYILNISSDEERALVKIIKK
ncbi:MAG: T9SS type A sorting domain-containing protein [Crocinitomicaceae bacterium]|nr:T9SS type A sorting domain-containing protein [Crocinitomicaceae bacterium]